MTATEAVFRDVAKLWAPPPKLTVSQWADANRQLARESSARSGGWRTRSYQREPMDAFTDPSIHTIVLMVARQSLKTEVINNCIGYVIDQDPGPTLVVQFRDTDCKRYSKIRLDPMLRETPCLREKVSEQKSRDGANTFEYKAFEGGHLSIVASSSPGNLAALPIRYLFCDEIDKYVASAGEAGDPISLAQGRQEEFWNRKTVLACTPTGEEHSRILDFFKRSDQRLYNARCPFCQTLQTLSWEQVKWDSTLPREKQPASALYYCAECRLAWDDGKRWEAVDAGQYVATSISNGIAGFWVNGLCRIGTRLERMVNEFLDKKDNIEELKTFVNEQLAEPWHEKGESPEWRRLYERSRNERNPLGIVPEGVLLLTAGADIQRDRIEVGVRGWGRNRESWIVDYLVLEGDPSQPEVWAKLTEALGRTYPNVDGVELQIMVMAVDTGYATQDVYNWVRAQAPGRVMAVKGQGPTYSTLVGQPKAQDIDYHGKKISNGVQVWPVGVAGAKSEFYGWLGLPTPTDQERAIGVGFLPGYCHFSDQLAEEFFEQITAEELVSRKVKGYDVKTWVKRRPRNEALDAYGVYARAAAAQAGIDRFQDRHWEQLEGMILTQKVLLEAKMRKEERPAMPAAVVQPRTRVFGKFRT